MKNILIYTISTLIALSAISLEAQEAQNKEPNKGIFFVGVEELATKADKGDTKALSTLANYFVNGIIVEKNLEMAVECYQKAADLGDIESAYNVAVLYQSGASKDKNAPALAFKYFKMAANENLAAMFNLGACYVNAIGTDQDLIRAYYCFAKAKAEFAQAGEIFEQIKGALDEDSLKAAEEFVAKGSL